MASDPPGTLKHVAVEVGGRTAAEVYVTKLTHVTVTDRCDNGLINVWLLILPTTLVRLPDGDRRHRVDVFTEQTPLQIAV